MVDGLSAVNTVSFRDAESHGAVQLGNLGRANGDGLVGGDLVNGGVLAPHGVLVVEGRYAQSPEATLRLGLGPRGHDQLVVDGVGHLAGTLTVELEGGYVPTMGERFVLLEGLGWRGGFEKLAWPRLPSGLAWELSIGPHAVTALVVPSKQTPADDLGSSRQPSTGR